MKVIDSVVMEGFNKPSMADRRKKVNYLIVSYSDNDGEYRRKFEFPRNMTFNEMYSQVPTTIS